MSGNVVNLRRFRKSRRRAEAQRRAAANRAKFGTSKERKAAVDRELERTRKTLDGARLEEGDAAEDEERD